jgi:hypothetical protein
MFKEVDSDGITVNATITGGLFTALSSSISNALESNVYEIQL